MPTYDYKCNACGHTFDELQSFSEPPLTKCPKCKKNKLERQFGGGGAIIFKGAGFYETDYRRAGENGNGKADADKGEAANKSETTAAKSDAPATSGDSTPAKSEAKTETKSESKSSGAKKKGK
jgi:putative FmdB family regulatory protein